MRRRRKMWSKFIKQFFVLDSNMVSLICLLIGGVSFELMSVLGIFGKLGVTVGSLFLGNRIVKLYTKKQLK